MKKYAIWNKVDPIITPIGEVLSPEEWIKRYPVAGLSSVTVVCSAGEINGGFFSTIGQMVQIYEAQGCDFSECTTNEEILNTIEQFEDAANSVVTITTEERIAAALEAQVLLSLSDVE